MNEFYNLPSGFRMRTVTLDDVTAVVEMLNAVSMAQIGANDFTVRDVQSGWSTPHFDLAQSVRVVEDENGRIAALAEVWDTDPLPVDIFAFVRVHPQYEGLGIGTALNDWAEARAKQSLGRVPEDVRVVLRSGTFTNYAPTQQLLAERGMKVVRHFWRMVISLEQGLPPAPAWPQGVVLKTYQTMHNLRAIYDAADEAFQDHWGHVDQPTDNHFKEWQFNHIESNPDFDPTLWFVAMEGDEITAVCLCRPFVDDDPHMGWVNTLGVRRPWRNKGLGMALLLHAFGEFHRRGQKRVGLGVDASSLTGATRLYEKAGMSPDPRRQWDVYEKELRPGKSLARE